MHRMIRCALLGVAIAAGACNSSTVTGSTTATTSPTLAAAVDHFTGTLTPNAALTFPFTVAAGGAVGGIIDSLTPDSTIVIGMSLGTWSNNLCQVVLSNDQATTGSSVNGAVTTSGSLCVRLYDVGNVKQSVSFVVEVGHP